MLARLAVITGFGCQKVGKSARVFKTFSTFIRTMENGEPQIKKKILQIGTHDGTFHCDEALACYMLRLLPEYENAKIVRSRKDEVLAGCDIVVDVGGVYDPTTHRYDHHQKTFDKTLSDIKPSLSKNYSIKLSSAGLVYAHFGERILEKLLDLSAEGTKAVYEKVYEYFIMEVDAIDNGVPICDAGEPKYQISTNLSSRVGNINPTWNAPAIKSQDELFERAVALTGLEFLDKVDYYGKSWWPARDIVAESVKSRFDVDPCGQVVELKAFVPWKQHFFDLEKEMGLGDAVRFFVFEDKAGWRVIAVPVEPNSFVCRTFLKREWWGLRDEELSRVAGVEGCVFCHHTGFIGGNGTREGAIRMALKSLA